MRIGQDIEITMVNPPPIPKVNHFTARVLDLVHETGQPKRVRIHSDLGFHGQVLMPHQYRLCAVNAEELMEA